MTKEIIVIGAGGHGKTIAETVLRCGGRVKGFLDDHKQKGSFVLDLPILGPITELYLYEACRFVLGIGDNALREQMSDRYSGIKWHTVIHPTSSIARGVALGEGCCIMAGAVIGPDAKIGRHCIVNTNADVEHDTVLEDFVHVAPQAVLCGNVHVGRQAFIGAGAVIKNGLHIADESIVGAGAVVIKPIDEKGAYAGVPARRLEKRE